jgi:spore germination protein YaaH
MVELIRWLTDQGDLSIDSTTVNAIVDDLLNLTKELAATQDSTVLLQNEINQMILDLNTKAPKQLVDSVQVQLGNVLQKLLDETNAQTASTKNDIQSKLATLRQIQYSCTFDSIPILQATVGDTLLISYKKCLNAYTKIFGYHQPSMNSKIGFYNFNYLTDIILNGYELGSNGLELNPNSLKSLLTGGILENNQPFQKDISLSVFSSSSSVISGFLSQSNAQTQLFSRLKGLISTYKLNGINIYFEGLQPKDVSRFSAFITGLRKELSTIDSELILTVSIPPIANSKDLSLASSIDFLAINSSVDYYLVQTQKLNITNTRIPFSLSPLYPDKANSRGSIQNTFSFYTNGKIPVSKLVMTLSYQGITWPMPDFVPGSRAKDFGSFINYDEIQSTIVSTIGQPEGAMQGYDAEQAAYYLNYGTLGNLKQVWYEDSQSLVDKYDWALSNGIGGVAIRGLGFDAGYSDLWDALGASLIGIDSVVVESKPIDTLNTKLTLYDYLWTYKQDIQWAGLNDIYIGNPYKSPVADYCFFETYPDTDSIALLAKSQNILSFWENRNAFERYDTTQYYSVNSKKDCVCMIGRWDTYSRLNGIITLVLMGLMLLVLLVLLIGIRNNGDEWEWRGLISGVLIGVGLLAAVSFFFYLFFNTQVGFIGAGSNEVTIWVLILIFGIGILAGLLINGIRVARKYTSRDLP